MHDCKWVGVCECVCIGGVNIRRTTFNRLCPPPTTRPISNVHQKVIKCKVFGNWKVQELISKNRRHDPIGRHKNTGNKLHCNAKNLPSQFEQLWLRIGGGTVEITHAHTQPATIPISSSNFGAFLLYFVCTLHTRYTRRLHRQKSTCSFYFGSGFLEYAAKYNFYLAATS